MSDSEFGGTDAAHGKTAITENALTWPQCQLQPVLHIEEDDGAVVEFLADDAFGLHAEAVTIEPEGLLQIVNAEGDDG
jgi:hypothetical protein